MPEQSSADGLQTVALTAILSVIGAVGGGCASTSPPDLQMVEVTVEDRSSEAMVLNFAMEGTNSNGFPLPLGDVSYRLDLDGRQVFRGVRSAQITIPRSGKGMIELPAAFELSTLDLDLQDRVPYRLVGSVRYRPDGTFPGVLYDSDFHQPSRSFSISGVLDFNPATRTGPFPGDEPSQTPRIDAPGSP